MCYPGSRLDVNTAEFIVQEVDDNITTSMLPTNIMEDIYGGDDQIFEFSGPGSFVKVCRQSEHTYYVYTFSDIISREYVYENM